MKFGIMFANTGSFVEPGAALALAQGAEAAGVESIWTIEHVVVPQGYASVYPYAKSGRLPGGEDFDIPDPLIWLAFVAAATTEIKLATGILIIPQRNPVVTAKAIATLDLISKGRVILGIGSGWLEESLMHSVLHSTPAAPGQTSTSRHTSRSGVMTLRATKVSSCRSATPSADPSP